MFDKRNHVPLYLWIAGVVRLDDDCHSPESTPSGGPGAIEVTKRVTGASAIRRTIQEANDRLSLISGQSRFPFGTPGVALLIEVCRHGEVENGTKDSIGEWDRGQLAGCEGGGSVRMKFMQQVPGAVQGISGNEGEGQTHADQGYRDKDYDRRCFDPPGRRNAEVGRESQVEASDHD